MHDLEYEKYVERKLEESLAEAQDPHTKWFTHDEAWSAIRNKP